jgi:alpha-tubulin suppressor-like RCC1 family protein/WD40 repeat protein
MNNQTIYKKYLGDDLVMITTKPKYLIPKNLILLMLVFIVGLSACGYLTEKPAKDLDTNQIPVVEINSSGREPQNFPYIAAGAGHTCMLTTSGRVECWGANQFGQLGGGDGPYTAVEEGPSVEISGANSWVKANVRGIPGKTIAIAAGYYHNCALVETGEIFCWGLNDEGQLGDNTLVNSNVAVSVKGLAAKAKFITAGAKHTCALLEDERVMCWGENTEGQLGSGDDQSSPSPVNVSGLHSTTVQLEAGLVFTCALTQDGDIYCWGNGDNGRFDENMDGRQLLPVKLNTGSDPIMEITGGSYHICARTKSAEVLCWGSLSSEQDFSPQNPFVLNREDMEYMQLVAGGGHTCGLTTSDAVYCWGDNYFGQLGDGSYIGSWSPLNAMGLAGEVLRIASGSGHVCAIQYDNSVKCWGDCSNGQCGDSILHWDWNPYTNRTYRFSLDYPREWKVLEVPNQDYPTEVDQVWFTQSSFPPSQSDARADLTLIITPEDPTPNWDSKYFENYDSEVINLRNIQAIRISGTNKESLAEEMVMIIQTNNYFIQALPNNSPESMRYFDQVMYTFNLDFELGSDENGTGSTCFTPTEILPFAISPEGEKLFVRASNGIEIIDLEIGEQAAFINSTETIVSSALSLDGQILAISLPDGNIQLIRTSDQVILAKLTGHADSAYDLLFSPLEDILISTAHDGIVRGWDFDGNQLKSINTGVEVVGMGLSWDGIMLAIIPSDGPVQIWDVEKEKKIAELGGTGGYDTSEAAFSPDGQYLAADLATGLYLWRVSDGELLWNDVKNSMAVAFSPDGQYLAYTDIDNSNEVGFRSPEGMQFIQVVDQMQAPVWKMFFSQDSALFVVTDGLEIHIWRVEDGKMLYIGKNECP